MEQSEQLNNRRKTNGRKTYFQMINANSEKGTGKRVVKHLQMSPTRLLVARKLLEHLERITRVKPEPKNNKINSRVIWNSQRKGTYIKAKHGEIGSK